MYQNTAQIAKGKSSTSTVGAKRLGSRRSNTSAASRAGITIHATGTGANHRLIHRPASRSSEGRYMSPYVRALQNSQAFLPISPTARPGSAFHQSRPLPR